MSAPVPSQSSLLQRYLEVRRFTEQLRAPLSAEDCIVQSMPDVSPTKWHLAHVTWFFETFVLKPRAARGLDYSVFDPSFEYLFNSYYNSVGAQYPRARRGLVTRPNLETVLAYRQHVDQAMTQVLGTELSAEEHAVVELGLHHEQQHQELLLMDIKHVLFQSPSFPVYSADTARNQSRAGSSDVGPTEFLDFGGGLKALGTDGPGFHFDNEGPRHQVHLEAYQLGSRLVTNGEFFEFMRDGGYSQPLLWLSDGWASVRAEGWSSPLYWVEREGEFYEFTLRGLEPLDLAAPVCHVSYFEADAFASWAKARLPGEAEWEAAAGSLGSVREKPCGNFVESGALHPSAARGEGLRQMHGDVWEWTASAYAPYPGFKVADGALGEYNGKFMVSQQVLRGGACVTSGSHFRPTYRNFFYPGQRWMFSGIRLAR
ncbi:MAG: ergothioneine biosynthesis protein EgtB [Myxococcales bacterium]|nr:ergothioneine biosynthesis protein EgtB [Myxococcales bacterium]MCB9607332.1 ergothioneine biosynthesis protein EgtB [Polyangiaceae bacterium]